jgi:hypothetical protein
LLHMVTLNDIFTQTWQTPWTSDRLVAVEPKCTTHNIHKRQISMPVVGFNQESQQANGLSPTHLTLEDVERVCSYVDSNFGENTFF